MKLSAKLIYYITGSKVAIALLFIISLPFLISGIASQYTNYSLRDQKRKVMNNIRKNGVSFYLQGDSSYGSYTMLKEEYIALEPVSDTTSTDTIRTTRRIVEQDTLSYRVLSHTFRENNKNYLLEIGKTTASINQYNKPLQRIALYMLMGLIAITLLVDLIFTRILIRPLGQIIRSKLVNRKFPFKESVAPVKTTTQDFRYLDQSLVSLMEQISADFQKEREFTANASHELMTPISILQTKMENLLAEEHITEEMSMAVIAMMKTLGRLKKISSSLLFISRIENDQFVKTDHVRPAILIAEVIAEIGHRMEEKKLHLEINLSPDAILTEVNQDLMFQYFYNLINNAIKYNIYGGSITITDQRTQHAYTITVSDTGIGIPQEELPFIFDRFRKTNLGTTTGYGLGLSIVKSIAIYHGFEIRSSSKTGTGSSFVSIFPSAI